MSERVEQMFSQLRKGPWNADPMGVPQEGFGGNGNVESQGWLSDGSVTADVIQANAVIAGKIDADAVTAREIAANTITAAEIAASTITAAQIAASTITSNEIAANTITAADIAANTITATEIASNAITADEIAANTITAAEIAANTITASEIAADAITTNELAANAVITENLLAGNVTSSKIELTVSGKNFGANDGTSGSPGVFFDSDGDSGLTRTTFGIFTVPTMVANGQLCMYFTGSGSGVAANGHYQVTADNTYDVGTTGSRIATVYRVAESAVSDEREKKDIADSPLGLEFVRALTPRAFRWRDTPDTQAREAVELDGDGLRREEGPHERAIRRIRSGQLRGSIADEDGNEAVERHRTALSEIRARYAAPMREAQQKRRPGRRLHYGLVAQEVKAALDSLGVDSMDAGFWQEAPGGEQSLSYTELIAPLLRAVQELAARVEELEHGRP